MNSSLANAHPPQPYLFRNYNLPVDQPSLYPGSCSHKVWEALRATTAAPGYFDEMLIGKSIHHDGSVLINNPCALGEWVFPPLDPHRVLAAHLCPVFCSYPRSKEDMGAQRAPGVYIIVRNWARTQPHRTYGASFLH